MKKFSIVLSVLLIVLTACNPVKRVLNDPAKRNQITEELIRRGICSNDTTIITQVTDTFFVGNAFEESELYMLDSLCQFDTTLKSGTRIAYHSGILRVREKIRTNTRVVTRQVDNYIRDTKLEDILKKDIHCYQDTVRGLNVTVDTLKKNNASLTSKIVEYKFYVIGLIILFIALTLWRISKIFRPI